MINFNSESKIFYLNTNNTSYIMKIMDNGMLVHWYYGAALKEDNLNYLTLLCSRNYTPITNSDGYTFSPDTAPMEYPVFGGGDFRQPALCVKNRYGQSVNELIYKEHSIIKGAVSPEGMPSFDKNTDDVQTLKIELADSISDFTVTLYYTVFEQEDAICRHSVITNNCDTPIQITNAQSLSLDISDNDLEIVTLHGTWARERHVRRRTLSEGTFSAESRRGATGHQQSPFAALCSPYTDENSGEAYGFSLCYSGNFKISAEVEPFGSTRLQIGINPFNFTYTLNPAESFTTPQAICVYSNKGFNGMSHCFHEMCNNHLGRCADKQLKRPLLINSWEAMYFKMSEEIIEKFVSNCKGLGIDTFVLDDGWFGHRNNDDSSLGDWFVDKNKFPNGLHNVVKACKKNGMNFGLWFEPEMISRDSELYKKHPDWCIHAENKTPTESRRQLVLDMARPEVVDCIYNQVAAILDEYDISYVKWDMNRNITDNGSVYLSTDRQGEHSHRYILGVYELMKRLTERFPNVLFEGCAGGGGRFDYGILYYMPQFWTSDDTDAIERLKIQYGTSFLFPPSTMTAHVSACPNHQTGRTVSFKTRGNVAQMCNFGYELDIAKLSEAEKEEIKEQVALHKRIEPMIYDGSFYRIKSPFDNDYCSWQLVSRDKKSSFVMFASQLAHPCAKGLFLKLKGLLPDAEYTVAPLGVTVLGSTLMNGGLPIPTYSDFDTKVFEINAVN